MLSESMDHPLPPGQRIGLRLHVLICRFCQRYMVHLRFVRQAVRRYAARAAESAGVLPSDARERILRTLSHSQS